MRVVIPDDYTHIFTGSPHLDRLRALGELAVFDSPVPDEEAAIRRLRGASIVVGNRKRTPLNRRVLEALPDLRLLSMTGTTFSNIDLEAATELGIGVTNTPDLSSRTVAEHAIALLMALFRRIPRADVALRRGEWAQMAGCELLGKTLGILGLGRIGREVARIGHALGMKVVAWDPLLSVEEVETRGATPLTLEDLLRTADAVSIHVKLTAETRGLVGAREISLMKPTAVLINTARGPILDESAVVAALRERRIGGAGLDVFAHEPLPEDSSLLPLDNVVLTPHMAWMAVEVYERFVATAVGNVESYLAGSPTHLINPEVWERRRGFARS